MPAAPASLECLRNDYDDLCRKAHLLAGRLPDLVQRASVYRQLWRESGGNHVFPLIAAHGALWAGGYFRHAMELGKVLSWRFAFAPAERRRKLDQLLEFADSFREINRQVCIETYVPFHFAARHGRHPDACKFVRPELLDVQMKLHAAKRAGRVLRDVEKLEVFEAHFRWEQTHVVGPAIEQAVAAFDWPFVRWLALKPIIGFAFFGVAQRLWFSDFSSQEQRVANGLRAFAWGALAGWSRVESSLDAYGVLPRRAFATPDAWYAEIAALATHPV